MTARSRYATAVVALLMFSSPAIAADFNLPKLIEDLADPDESVRWTAASDIGELGTAALEATGELTLLLSDPESFVRSIAADSLLRIGGDAATVRPLLSDPEADVRLSVATSLLRTGVEIDAATDVLVELSAAEELSVDVDDVFMALSQERAGQVAPRLLTIAAEDDSEDMRRSARYEFTQLDVDLAEFADRLVPLLNSEQIDVRRMAAKFLTTVPSLPESTREPLLNALSDDDDQVRVHLALCLSGFNPVPPDALPEIRRAFNSHDESVVHIVVDEVNRRPELSEELIPELIDVLGCGNPFTREDAVEALARMDAGHIVPVLMGMVTEPDARITHAYLWEDIAELTSRYGPEAATAIPSLVHLSDYSGVDVRKASLRSLAVVGIRDPAAIACISRHLREDTEELRIEAAKALAAAVGDDEALRINARRILRERLADSSPHERAAVVAALLQIGEPPRAVLPALKLLLNDENGTVVQQALSVYAQLGPRARTAVPALIDAFESDAGVSAGFGGWMLHQSVPYVLGEVGVAAVPPLVAALEHPNPQVRGHAAESLGWIGADAAPALSALVDHLDDLGEYKASLGCSLNRITVRAAVIQALGSIGPASSEVVPTLVELLNEPVESAYDAGFQVLVIQALWDIGPPSAAAADELWKLVETGYPEVQWTALRALAVITPQDPRIVAEVDRQIRWVVDYCPLDGLRGPFLWDELGSLAKEWGPRAIPLTPTLEHLVTSAPLLETDVRVDAAFALAVIDPEDPVAMPYLQRQAAYEARIWRSLYLRSAQEALDELEAMQVATQNSVP